MNYDVNKNSVSPEAKNLAVFLQTILDRVNENFSKYSMPLPSRQYWTMGQPALDCEQVVVSFIQMYLGSPGDEATAPRRGQDPRSATINVSVSRKIPVVGTNGRPPAAEAIQEASEIAAYDSWILLDIAANHLDVWVETGLGLGIIATVEVRDPDGGIQTTVLTLTAAVP